MTSTYKIFWTVYAEMDLEELFEFISKGESPELAYRTCADILHRVSQLAEFPLSGRKDSWLKDVGSGYRYVIKGRYRIVYCVEDRQVQILRVFDMRRRPEVYGLR